MGEAIAFYAISVLVLLSAVLVVTHKNLFRCALLLGLVFFGVAGFFVLLGAEFLAGAQVLIYVGAVTVLILFAVMLSEELAGRRIFLVSRNKFLGLMAGLGFAGVVIVLAASYQQAFRPPQPSLPKPLPELLTRPEVTNTSSFGSLLLTKFIVPFEFASILLLIALVGAIVIARRAE